jgi:HEAT repeat protein
LRNDRIERQLEELKALRAAGASEETAAALGKALDDRVNVVAAKAAAIVAELQLQTLIPDLRKAFARLFEKPTQTDPQCWGKNAIAKALKDLGHAESKPFLRGLQHVQMEPVWNGQEDTAAVLRGTCAMALVQCTDITRHEIILQLIEALTEEKSTVRADAARAIEQMDGREAVWLLRLKARVGDREPPVTGQVFESLLHLEGHPAVSFVERFLDVKDEEVREEAALALGGSRLPQAIEALKGAWIKRRGRMMGPILLRAISASRQDAAIEFLLNLVREGDTREAEDALRALELHRDSDELSKRIAEAAADRGDTQTPC